MILPSNIILGKQRVVLVFDETSLTLDVDTVKLPLKLNVGEWKNWLPDYNFLREDIIEGVK